MNHYTGHTKACGDRAPGAVPGRGVPHPESQAPLWPKAVVRMCCGRSGSFPLLKANPGRTGPGCGPGRGRPVVRRALTLVINLP